MSDTSKKDEAVLAELSDQTIEVDPNGITDVCTKWSRDVLTADLSTINVETAFQPLTSVGVATAYIPSLKTALEKVENMILSASNYVKQAAQEQSDVDEKSSQKDRDYNTDTGNGRKSSRSSNNNNNGNNNNNNNSGNSNNDNTTVDDTQADNTQAELDINTVVESVNKMTYESYIKFMTALEALTSGKLTEYLTEESYAESLKKLILESPEFTEDFKASVKDMDAKDVQILLQNILVNKDNVSDLSKTIIGNYTESQSEKSELTAASPSNGFFDDVDSVNKDFTSILNDSNISKKLLEIYDGSDTEVDDKTMDFVRTTVDELAKSKNMTYTELLSGQNETMLKSEMESVSKSLTFFKTVSALDTSISGAIYKSIIG